MWFFRAVALDLDGTLTEDGQLSGSGMAAYHLARGDFSRWITGVLADRSLGTHLAAIERDVGHRHAAELERARHRIIHAIDSRYPGTDKP